MCGIAGWVDWHKDLTQQHAREILQAMTDTMACRGPDAEGTWVSSHAAFGHRRLAVIDIEGGHQPMVKHGMHSRTYVVTYGGEIYNFGELRLELQACGHTFITRSDTEVLLTSYMEWGEACVEHLNGIFAFGIWDETQQELFLARDRFGVKPLFYAQREGGILFGSEPKALLANPLVSPTVDLEGLSELFAMFPLRTPGQSIYKNVYEVRPGYCLRFNRSGSHTKQYWKLESHPHPDDVSTTAQNIRELLDDIVERQLVSDVPYCTLLSGGLDSSALSALAMNVLKRKDQDTLRTFAVDFKDSAKDFTPSIIRPERDTPYAHQVSNFIQSVHRDIVLDTPDLVEHFFDPLRARDLPSVGEMDTSLYLMFKALRQEATVALSGESADEVFGGYPWFHSEESINQESFPMLMAPSDILSAEVVNTMKPAEYRQDRYWQAMAEVPRLEGENRLDQRMREIFYLHLVWGSLPMLLERKDRMSMAVGLEVRVPFCDHRLVQYVWNIPWAMKTVGHREKGILREAVKDLLPDEVLYRKKSAYPGTQSPAYVNAIQTEVQNILADTNAPIGGLIDREKVRELLKPHASSSALTPSQDKTHRLAFLIQVNRWLQDYHIALA